MNKILKTITKHPLVTATGTSLLGKAINSTYRYIINKCSAELQVDSFGTAYNAIVEWIITQDLLKTTNMVKFATSRQNTKFTIPDGDIWTWYKGRPLRISKASVENGNYGRGETLKLTLFGGTKEDILKIVNNIEMPSTDLKVNVNIQVFQEGYWQNLTSKGYRDPDTFILKEGQKELILDDVDWFMKNKEWYIKKGIPYHRGYLISGPTGTGKTTLVNVVASKFKRPVNVINLGALTSDDQLYNAVSQITENAIIALEDIDCVGIETERKETTKQRKGKDAGVTLGGLLNCLDGLITPDGAMIFMTTNHPEKLDSAIMRPGRADIHAVFDFLERKEQEKLSLLFFDRPVAVNKPHGAAVLQGLYMRHLDNPEAAQKELETM